MNITPKPYSNYEVPFYIRGIRFRGSGFRGFRGFGLRDPQNIQECLES